MEIESIKRREGVTSLSARKNFEPEEGTDREEIENAYAARVPKRDYSITLTAGKIPLIICANPGGRGRGSGE